ncbi:MAG: cupin-like domain-containing protein [Calothrix sp. MO_167.B42]|nr:cupin-like domain-containing protein [Calothrix sp. MO_167.B42]
MKKISAITKLLLYYFREAIHLWFGLRLLFTKNLSEGSTYDPRYNLGYWIMLKFKIITLCQWFFNNHRLFAKAEHKNTKAALERLKKQAGEGSSDYLSVDEVTPDIDPNEFYEKYVKYPRPVVIRGLAKDCEAIKKWNREFFLDKYGNTKLYMNEINYGEKIEVREWMGELSEVLERKGVYLDNSKILFTQYPELRDDIALVREWGKFFKNSIYLIPQLFLGCAPGAPYHCANFWNFFVMVDGEKQWTFINPEHSLQVGALVNPTAIYVDACVTGKGGTWRDESELFKRYCPKYRTTLKKGDVLLNPPWWWHEIKNQTPFTIGMATRWIVFNHQRTNFLFDVIQMVSRQMWQVHYQSILTNGGMDLGIDEDDEMIRKFLTNRDKNSTYNRDYEYRCHEKISTV